MSLWPLASSFNMRGKLRRLFYVLSDDHIGSGPRPAPHSLKDPIQSDTDHDHDYAGTDVEMVGTGVSGTEPEQSTSSQANTHTGSQAGGQVGKRKADSQTPSTRGKSRK
jgi:hypothetical protein